MTDDTNTTGIDGVDRRTLLQATGVSLTGTALVSGTAIANDGGGNRNGQDEDRPDSRPDLSIMDNSTSNAPVEVEYRLANDDEGEVIASERYRTIGLARAIETAGDEVPDESAVADAVDDASERVDKITFDDQSQIFEDESNEIFEVVVSHQSETDSTLLWIGPDGAEPTETASVHIDRDGSISADTIDTH